MTCARTTYRYPVDVIDNQVIRMPAGARILNVARREGRYMTTRGGIRHESVDLWALVDPNAPLEDRHIRVAGTGYPLLEADNLEYLGTVQLRRGELVFHVFERLTKPAKGQFI